MVFKSYFHIKFSITPIISIDVVFPLLDPDKFPVIIALNSIETNGQESKKTSIKNYSHQVNHFVILSLSVSGFTYDRGDDIK